MSPGPNKAMPATALCMDGAHDLLRQCFPGNTSFPRILSIFSLNINSPAAFVQVQEVSGLNWGTNTNVNAVFDLILKVLPCFPLLALP